MKKLMIAAAIVCAATFAQAATCLWEAGDIYTYAGKDKTSSDMATDYLVYFVDAANYGYTDAQTALAKGDYSFLESHGKLGEIDAGYVVGEVSGYNAKDVVLAYSVILNSDTIAGATAAYLSGTETDTIGDLGQDITLLFDTSDSATGNNWTVAAVPEPTSGLLLLLGMAGLALRRRRA